MAEQTNGAVGARGRGVLLWTIVGAFVVVAVARDVLHPYRGGVPFNTALFLAFFVWFYVLYHFVAATRAQKLWLITIGSLLFYGTWGLEFVPLILATGLVDFWLAKRIEHAEEPRAKKGFLALSVGMNLVVLSVFKYTGFFTRTAFDVAHLFGSKAVAPVIEIAMPIGISFYTFQAISYTVDVYRGNFKPRKQLHEFVAGLTFFPHLAAGPIVRSSFLLPQFEAPSPPKWPDVKRAFLLIATGLLNKTIADLLAFVADPLFAAKTPQGALDSWTAVLAFGGQVYGDFCGYTDVATGVALLLGFTLPPNFELPYLSRSPAEFWRRWHISLSSWLRDYLWFPLARRFSNHRYAPLVLTMFLVGLWHGAAWNFAIWGVYHGILLVLTAIIGGRFPRNMKVPAPLALGQWLLTTYLVFVGFAIFRAEGVRSMLELLREMHAPTEPSELTYASAMTLALVVAGLIVGHGVSWVGRDPSGRIRKSLVLWPLLTLLFAMSLAMGRIGHTFLYFQF